jgi:hypothetical protein
VDAIFVGEEFGKGLRIGKEKGMGEHVARINV